LRYKTPGRHFSWPDGVPLRIEAIYPSAIVLGMANDSYANAYADDDRRPVGSLNARGSARKFRPPSNGARLGRTHLSQRGTASDLSPYINFPAVLGNSSRSISSGFRMSSSCITQTAEGQATPPMALLVLTSISMGSTLAISTIATVSA